MAHVMTKAGGRTGLPGIAASPGKGLMRTQARAALPLPVLIFLFCIVIPLQVRLGPLYLTTLRFYLLIMIIPLGLMLLSGRAGRVLATDTLVILHILWAAVALAMNNPNQVVEQIGSVGSEFLGGYLIGRCFIRSPEAFIALVRWLIRIICCLAPFVIYETLTGQALLLAILAKVPGMSTLPDVGIERRLGLERVQSVFSHPIHFGLFCSVVFAMTFVAMKGVLSTPTRWILSGVAGMCGFLALSSGALLAMLLQVALILWASIFAPIRWRWWLLLGLFALAYVVIDILSNRPPIRVFMSYATFSTHNAYWRGLIFEFGMQNVWANPIYGLGLNDWVRPSYMYSGSMDNFWLVMAVRYGIPGFLLLVTGYILLVFHVMRRNFDADPVLAQIRRAWVFTFLGLSFTMSTVHVWTNIYSFIFFMFGAGVWLVTVQPRTADPKAEEGAPAPAGRPGALPYSRFAPRARGADTPRQEG